MKIQTITLAIPVPLAMVSPAPATSITTPSIQKVLEDTIQLHGNHITVDVDCNEDQKNADNTPLLVACDWFVVKNGQTRPPSGLINKSIKLPNGVVVHLASTCIN